MPLSIAQNPLPTENQTALKETFSVGFSVVGATGVVLRVSGSASGTIFITRLSLITAASDTITTAVRSTATTLGTSATVTDVPHDSTNSAANATVRTYTVAPTAGALVGNVAIFVGTSVTYEFAGSAKQPITLRGTAQELTVSLTAGTTLTGFVEWYEA